MCRDVSLYATLSSFTNYSPSWKYWFCSDNEFKCCNNALYSKLFTWKKSISDYIDIFPISFCQILAGGEQICEFIFVLRFASGHNIVISFNFILEYRVIPHFFESSPHKDYSFFRCRQTDKLARKWLWRHNVFDPPYSQRHRVYGPQKINSGHDA